jgi:hypothetical protein
MSKKNDYIIPPFVLSGYVSVKASDLQVGMVFHSILGWDIVRKVVKRGKHEVEIFFGLDIKDHKIRAGKDETFSCLA